MSTYMIAKVQLTDYQGADANAGTKAGDLITESGGRYVLYGTPAEILEGEWLDRQRAAVVSWPSVETAEAFFNSDQYQKELKPQRAGTSIADIGLFEAIGEASSEPSGKAYLFALAQMVLIKPELAQYRDGIVEMLPEYGGNYLIISAPLKVLEGQWMERQAISCIEFPSLDQARAFWNADAYQKDLKPLREGTGVFDVVLFEGA